MSRGQTVYREKKFRNLIWELDRGLDRCFGTPLDRSRSADWKHRGEVCHLRARSLAPEKKYDPSNAFLLSAYLHFLSDGRGGYRLKILGDDARKPLTFRMHDKNGDVLWQRVG